MGQHLRDAEFDIRNYSFDTKLEDVYVSDLNWHMQNLKKIMNKVVIELPKLKYVLSLEYKEDLVDSKVE